LEAVSFRVVRSSVRARTETFPTDCRLLLVHLFIYLLLYLFIFLVTKGKGSPYSIAERRVPELIPVLGIQPAGDVDHKPGGRLPLLSARPAVTPGTLKRAAISFTAW